MRPIILIAAAALGGCSRPVLPQTSAVEQAIAGRVAGPAQTCISTNPAENLQVLDRQTAAYGSGRTIYINRLAGACPELNHFNILIVEGSTGGQYCRADRVSGLEPGAVIPGPSCALGLWIPYRMH